MVLALRGDARIVRAALIDISFEPAAVFSQVVLHGPHVSIVLLQASLVTTLLLLLGDPVDTTAVWLLVL